ncbi:MAG TPA: alpha/beta hydrolase [Rheinheimera sp.]|nr:alpha/beta hydrolase [Rheinheimera sp.]
MKILLLPLLALLSIPSFAASKGSYPASTTELTFNSYGKRMSGFIYIAEGEGPHPTVLLLHGYPGNEKNLDVAQALRQHGWNVAFFHYRGAWGSEGEFSFLGAEKDVQVVLDYLANKNNAKQMRVNPELISTVGHSMGGHMAIAGILDNPAVRCSVAWDGANLGARDGGLINDPKTTIPWKEYSDTLFMLNGWSGLKAQRETEENSNQLDLIRRAPKINGRPVLLIGANTAVIPHEQHIAPLLKALSATTGSQITYKLIDDDHSFNSTRELLIDTTITFLDNHCRI